jgi:hypothetical protein
MRIADRVSARAFLSGLALGSMALPTAALACDAAAAAGRGQSSDALSRTGDPTVGVDWNAPDEARALFRQADSDANGTISPEEWRDWRERISAGGAGG